MRSKSETSNFGLPAHSKGIFYFRKYGTDEKVSAVDYLVQYFSSSKAEQLITQEGSPRPQHYIDYRVWENSMRLS